MYINCSWFVIRLGLYITCQPQIRPKNLPKFRTLLCITKNSNPKPKYYYKILKSLLARRTNSTINKKKIQFFAYEFKQKNKTKTKTKTNKVKPNQKILTIFGLTGPRLALNRHPCTLNPASLIESKNPSADPTSPSLSFFESLFWVFFFKTLSQLF